jgi:hypothetical protein
MTALFNGAQRLAGAAALGLILGCCAGAAQAQDWSNWETWSGRYIGPHPVVRCDDYGYCYRVIVRGHDRYAGLNVDGTPIHGRRHYRRYAQTQYGYEQGAYPYGYQGGAYGQQGYQSGYQGQAYQGGYQGYQGDQALPATGRLSRQSRQLRPGRLLPGARPRRL